MPLHSLSVTGGSPGPGPDVVTIPGPAQSGPTPPSRHPTNLNHISYQIIFVFTLQLQLLKTVICKAEISCHPVLMTIEVSSELLQGVPQKITPCFGGP